MHFQQLKGMQSSKLGMLKGYHLSLDGIQKGTLSVKNGIYESKGLDLGPGGWGGGVVTWVIFCWVCADGLSELLPHCSLFCCPL